MRHAAIRSSTFRRCYPPVRFPRCFEGANLLGSFAPGDMVAGYSNREIAGAVGVTEGTVKNHVSSILSKLGVRDRTRAVLKALELGFI
jgi:hypothetical protein